MKKQHIQLASSDKIYLEELLSKGTLKVSKVKRAQALLELNKGRTYRAVSDLVGVTNVAVSTWAKKYKSGGLTFWMIKLVVDVQLD